MTQPARSSGRLRPLPRPSPRSPGPSEPLAAPQSKRSAAFAAPEPLWSPQELESSDETSLALLPLLRRLASMVVRPSRLVAALLEPVEGLASDLEALEARAVVFQRQQLRGQAAAWQVARALSEIADGGADGAVAKAALFYWRLWALVSAACVEAVARTQRSVAAAAAEAAGGAQKRRHALVGSPSGSEDGMSPGKRPRLTRQSNEFLIGWFLAHKASPYPSAGERLQIAARTGLSEQQVRNWFANMRKRHWKPSRPASKKPRCLLDYVLRSPEPTPTPHPSL